MASVASVLSILGGVVVLLSIIHWCRIQWRQMREFSWKQVDRFSDCLVKELQRVEFKPSTIIGLGRGGAIVAGIVASRLRMPSATARKPIPIQSIDRVYLLNQVGHRDHTAIIGIDRIDPQGQRILLLNADNYSGDTLEAARQVLLRGKAAEVKTGTLLQFSEGAEFLQRRFFPPDFCGSKRHIRQERRMLPWRRKGDPPFGNELRSLDRHLVVLHGMVATGKTSITDAMLRHASREPGFVPIHSDWFWFKHGLQNREKDPSVSVQHNLQMVDLCWSVVGSGRDAILDCTSRSMAFRKEIRETFGKWGITVVFVRCQCRKESCQRRIEKRSFIGIHDFGTIQEYERVASSYEPIVGIEEVSMNLIDIDTDALEIRGCKSQMTEVREWMESLCSAIEDGYLTPMKRKRANGGLKGSGSDGR